ncbi:MAG: hypothetical protein HC895_08215 [Leptolyngbyaceae cyanobacterium SM1_3_5]|nr:hypothetical protein [Leptolyngbyaceae cyanobacterium SM1_3_5]
MSPAELYALYCQCDRSTRKTAHALRDRGITISHETVRQRLVAAGYKLRAIGGIEAQNPLDAVVATRVEPALANWLRSLPGEKDAHLREALRRYRARGAVEPSGGKIGAGELVSGRVERN